MPDPIEHPEIPSALTDMPQADAMAPEDGSELVKRTTNEVETDDMFVKGGE